MIILLLTLLVVALSITAVGWMLSPRNPISRPKKVSYAVREQNMPRRVGEHIGRAEHVGYGGYIERVGRVGANRQMRVRRAPVEIERRAWSNILASLNIGQLFEKRPSKPTPWLGIMLVLIALFAFGTYSLRALLPNSALVVSTSWLDSANAAAPAPASNAPTLLFPGISGAAKNLVRIYQLDPAQYYSQQDYDTWAYSTCSAASMAEVINAYGHHYRLADILKVEAGINQITPDLGLLQPTGIDKTVAQFGFKVTWLVKPSLDDAIRVANTGRPVIINFPPDRWAGGHVLVMLGGDKDHVYVADSSRLNMKVFTRAKFLQYWVGFAVVVEPK
jgi:hypothetical protein